MNVIVDSDVLIEVSRRRNSEIARRWAELSDSEHKILSCPVTIAELWHGALPKEFGSLTALLNFLTCVPHDAETGRLAGDFLRHYHKSHNLELSDTLIAATAVQHRAALWTRNRKHYPMKDLTFF